MAIQMRRGKKEDFDPSKLLPGEWAVSVDTDMNNQVVWMCFAAGVVKRMGTYEDFWKQFEEMAEEIKAEYLEEFNALLEQVEQTAFQVSEDREVVVQIHSDVVNYYLPQMLECVENVSEKNEICKGYADFTSTKAGEAQGSALLAESHSRGGTGIRDGEDVDNSKYYSERAKEDADTSKEYLGKVEQAGNEAVKKLKDALDVDAPEFQMDIYTGHLMYEGGRFAFNVNSSGHLEWRLAI